MDDNTTLTDTATPPPTDVWGIHDIAAFYRRSVTSARRKVRMEGFPAPLVGDRNRWFADDIRRYARPTQPVAATTGPERLAANPPVERIVRRNTRGRS